MNILVYPKCTTCKKAIKWLKDNEVEAVVRHIVEEPLSKEEIKALHLKSGVEIKKFFNTSGIKYRELGLKDKLKEMSLEECYDLLASDGMLVKRPLAYDDEKVLRKMHITKYGKNRRKNPGYELPSTSGVLGDGADGHYVSLYSNLWNLSDS